MYKSNTIKTAKNQTETILYIYKAKLMILVLGTTENIFFGNFNYLVSFKEVQQ